MNEFTPALVVSVLGGVMAVVQAVRFKRGEIPLLLASFVAHLLSALVQVRVGQDLYNGGDMLSYSRYGILIGRELNIDVYRFAPEVFRLAIGPPANLPFVSQWAGTPMGVMMAIGGVLSYVTGGGPNTFCLCVAIWAYFGQVALYRAFSMSLPEAYHRRLLVATLLVPSCVFWASSLLKESVAIGGMGLAVLGFVRMRQAVRFGPLVLIAIGGITVGLVKPYILFALILGAGAWLYAERERGRARGSTLVQLAVGAVVALGGVALLTTIFPEFALGSFAERAAAYQANTEMVEGGSNYAIGDTTQTTFAGQLPYAPLALATALFRPFLFEVRSPQAAVSAVETAWLLFMAIRAFRRRSVAASWAMVSSQPVLTFCLAFTFCLGLGVGFTTTNMGTLSRYRMPLIPFFSTLILILDAPALGSTIQSVGVPVRRAVLRRQTS